MDINDLTDTQITEAALHRAARDLGLPASKRAVRAPRRGQGRPTGDEDGEDDGRGGGCVVGPSRGILGDGDNKIEWATDDLMLDRCKPAVPGDRMPYPERFGLKGGE